MPLSRAADFVLRGIAGSLGLFGLLRLPWLEARAVLPFVQLQGTVAARLFGAPASPVDATLACSGADAIALCLGAVFAYPAPWRRRFAGAAGGLALILALNIIRIGTLGRAAASPRWFDLLHLYAWPAVLTLAIAGYVFAWMRIADRPDACDTRAIAPGSEVRGWTPSRRFVGLTVAFVVLFAAASQWYLESSIVLALAGVMARAAAFGLGLAGVAAHAAANVLWTPRGGFAVTQECISTPLIPVYLAAVCAYSTTWRRMIVGVLATLPLFTALGVMRLLVVALPDVVAPLFLVHAFYQVLLGVVVVCVAALWRHGRSAALRYAAVGVSVGALFVLVIGPYYTRAVTLSAAGPIDDPQGAIAFLPSFQAGLYLAVWVAAFAAVGWWRFLGGLVALGATHAAVPFALHALGTYTGLTAHVRDVRGWAVVGPILVIAAVINLGRTRR